MGQLAHPHIFILSGPRMVGKTTFLMNLRSSFPTKDNLVINGIISPPVFTGDLKTGINLQDVSSGETRALAILHRGENEGTFTEKWLFNEENLLWGDSLLANATPCDLLIVDELGPIEFYRGKGFQNGLLALDSRKYVAAIVVIRPELIPNALERWPEAEVFNIEYRGDTSIQRMLDQIKLILVKSGN